MLPQSFNPHYLNQNHSVWSTCTIGGFVAFCLALPFVGFCQINTGSTGSDGSLNPASNIVIDMHDHPSGIYQYASVNISGGITVTFLPNAANTPVIWLVQSNVVINGTVDVSGKGSIYAQAGMGGPGGWGGGNGGSGTNPISSPGLGPGAGSAGYIINSNNCVCAGQASFGTLGSQAGISGPSNGQFLQPAPGGLYGNNFLIPLIGGCGGGGFNSWGGGGGGGAILIAANGYINVTGSILANGGSAVFNSNDEAGGGGSGGAIRLVATSISGNEGRISASGGTGYFGETYNSDYGYWQAGYNNAGNGRIRFDTYQNNFSGYISDAFTQGYQPIIIPIPGQGPQLNITSIGGVPVSATPTGQVVTPDAIISSQQNNPVPIVVNCVNIPLNTQITISVNPANASPVSAIGQNTTGTQASSTATISIVVPRGGGLIYATATTSN